MDEVILRKARPTDATALGDIHVASWRETYAGILPDEMLADLSADARAAMWRDILCRPDDHGGTVVFVVEDAGRMIGFGACAPQRDAALADAGYGGEIGALYVLAAHQRRGAGRAIMRAMARALRADGHDGACLWVLRENRSACAFYEALGGIMVRETIDDRDGAMPIEVAYGWRDLSALIG